MTEIRKVTRYHTKFKNVAFNYMNEKNKVKGKNVWRVAIKVKNRIIFDIDDLDEQNIREILKYYQGLFFYGFRVIKTLSGYHLISKVKYTDNLEWQYDVCRVLYPLLERKDIQNYIEKVQKFYKDERKKQQIDGLDRKEFIEYLPQKFIESGLFCGIGNFDMLFAINVIMKDYYCLRISKKAKGDKPVEVEL